MYGLADGKADRVVEGFVFDLHIPIASGEPAEKLFKNFRVVAFKVILFNEFGHFPETWSLEPLSS